MQSSTVIVTSLRTPVGKAKRGALRFMRPEEMGAEAVRAALDHTPNLSADEIDDVLIGCAFPEGSQGMNVGRIIAGRAGLPDSVPGATVNRFCSSGLQTIAMANQAIALGQAECIVAGGAESMTLVPMSGYYFQPDPETAEHRPEVYVSMGNTAENLAQKYDISREDQDLFALRSHERALAAQSAGLFEEELIPLYIKQNSFQNGTPKMVSYQFSMDEGPRADTSLEALSRLRPVFRSGGSVTAGNSSQMSDGAAATVVMSEGMAQRLGVKPLARMVGFAVAGVAPELMGIGPVPAIKNVLEQTGLSLDQIGLIELNEAFAAQALAVIREANLDESIVNVQGGAIALGHPLGCTGAKLTATLLHAMNRGGIQYGLCTMCIGGGMGAAAIFENLSNSG
ncbi:MAG: thiolase family protein [Bacteroidota bacterium]|nr:thiolase family protein [Bacteroidota bacterium]MXW14821.1 thiolase family protein [Rhodothermaceae bacterium]MDE2644839.1 thiolase family protein [Bacteroidota bacterium]MXW32669.1 thiolase family protein [Rhodothermaceae bacterium]MYC03945.1 thiolase family protein [Rhodothermaceae bacterium]